MTPSGTGMAFYVGNHPNATGIYKNADFLTSAEAQRRSGKNLTHDQAAWFWIGEGFRFIISGTAPKPPTTSAITSHTTLPPFYTCLSLAGASSLLSASSASTNLPAHPIVDSFLFILALTSWPVSSFSSLPNKKNRGRSQYRHAITRSSQC
jgi:hypothetical protein